MVSSQLVVVEVFLEFELMDSIAFCVVCAPCLADIVREVILLDHMRHSRRQVLLCEVESKYTLILRVSVDKLGVREALKLI